MTRRAALTRRNVAGTLGLLMSLVALGLPGQAWATQTESSTQTINSTATSIPGIATSINGGIGVAGPAVALNIPPIVVQGNIQVDTTGNPNNVQDASNELTVDQQAVAAAGHATGDNGGVATSGSAIATSAVVVMQMNIQLIMGSTPDGGVIQTAANVGDLDQVMGAASGDAGADGGGSTATSGNANAGSTVVLNQSNVQAYLGTGAANTVGSVQIDALNTAAAAQGVISATGIASAADGGTAVSGDAQNFAMTMLQQSIGQTVNE